MKTMMKLRSLLVLLFIYNTSLFHAQLQEQTYRCGFDHVHNQQLQNSEAYRIQIEQFNEFVQNFSYDSRSGETPKIPVCRVACISCQELLKDSNWLRR